MDDAARAPPGLTGAEFEALCRLAFGAEWQGAAARALSVSLRNVQYFAGGGRPVPPGVTGELAEIVATLARDPSERRRMAAALATLQSQVAVMRAALERGPADD